MVWMTVFHFCFDLSHFGYWQQDFLGDPFWTVQRTLIVSLFLLCAGMGQAVAWHRRLAWPRFWRRFFTIVLPLLSPTTFFLLVVNIVYAFFETFGVIHTITSGGPQQATTILVYKVYADGFVGQDLGSSAAQSVVLLVVVGFLTVLQFKFVEKRVHY